MRWTRVLLKHASKRKPVRSLALSVHFQQPEFGMKDFEILSRATAFLLAVDPANPHEEEDNDNEDGPYSHLARNERERKVKMHRQHHRYTPVGGPHGRELKELGWLEYAPREVRPAVHCVCSSHVLAPFLWKDYYQQDWLSKVRQEHCRYSLEVFDPEEPTKESLGTFALNPYPIHHPEGRDIALLHLKQEDENLRLMQELGVQVLRLRDLDEIYEKNDEVTFDGYAVAEASAADSEEFQGKHDDKEKKDGDEDGRVFFPYQETGKLAFHTRERFFATTPVPLPEGLCGGPVIDGNGFVAGIVEGIVDKGHSNKDIAGSAAFMPNYMMTPFIDFAERFMLQRILPKGLFERAVTAKTTNSLGGSAFQKDKAGRFNPGSQTAWEEEFERAVEQLKKNHSEQEVEAILNTIQRERKEVLEVLDKEGGEMEEVAERVRQRTLQLRELIHEEYRKVNASDPAGTTAESNNDAK